MFQKIKALLFENRTTKQTVAKNTFWLTVSNFGGKFLKAIIIIYAARVLGTAGYGVFSYAITLASFLTLFMEPGINGILIRDASGAAEEDRRAIFDTAFAMKIVLILIGIAVVAFAAPFFTTLPGAKTLLPVVAFVLALDTLREFFSSLLRAMERMEWEAVVFILTNLGIVVFGFVFLLRAATPQSFGWGYVAGDAVGLVAAVAILRRYFKKILSFFSPSRVIPILKSAWPFAVGGIFGMLFTNTDILIISWMRSASDVGIYSAAIRIVQTLYLIPGIVQLSTLPLLSRLAKNDRAKFRAALEQTLSMVFFASIPLSLGGIILGTPIMKLLFGAPYTPGGLSLEILMATLLFDFAATIVINALFAYDHQRSMVISAAIAGTLNVALDLLLIPPFGITGSAVATLVAQALNNWYLWHAMKKVNYFAVTTRLRKIIVAGAVMAASTVLFAALGVELIVNIALSGAIYFLILRALREPLLIEVKRLLFPMTAPAAPAAES